MALSHNAQQSKKMIQFSLAWQQTRWTTKISPNLSQTTSTFDRKVSSNKILLETVCLQCTYIKKILIQNLPAILPLNFDLKEYMFIIYNPNSTSTLYLTIRTGRKHPIMAWSGCQSIHITFVKRMRLQKGTMLAVPELNTTRTVCTNKGPTPKRKSLIINNVTILMP